MTWKSRHWLWLLLLLPVGLGLARLRFDIDVLNLLPANVRAVQGLKLYQENFSDSRELILTVRAPDPDQAEHAARTFAVSLRAHTNLVQQAVWQPPWDEHPGEAAELLAHLWLNQPPEIFAQLTNHLAPENAAATLFATREQLATSLSPGEIAQLSYDPFGLTQLPEDAAGAAPQFGRDQDLFASPDGTFRIVFLHASAELPTYRDCLKWLNAVHDVLETARTEHGISENVTVGATGRPAFVAEISTGMERDMRRSVGTTVLVIIALFWWVHRRWQPLAWLLTLLVCVLGGTMAIGGLLFGTLNVVSAGFAAILLGLSVDYGLVLYQESLHDPSATAAQLRRRVGRSIIWSAVTSAGAFSILNLSGLPGLAQLGSLVAIGVVLGATVMLTVFLPPLMRKRVAVIRSDAAHSFDKGRPAHSRLAWTTTVLILAGAAIVLWRERPPVDHTANSLRPRHSPAYAAIEEIQTHIGRAKDPYWLLISGDTEEDVARRLQSVQPVLERAEADALIDNFNLPGALWPDPETQSANREIARQLASQRDALHAAALAEGFTADSFTLTDNILQTWQRATESPRVFWPTNEVSRWVFDKVAARAPGQFYALGLVNPTTTGTAASVAQVERLESQLPRDNVWLAGWERLGSALLAVVERDFWRVLGPMTALLLLSLWLAFRRVTEVLLSLMTLAFSAICLLTVMSLAGWSWNLLNLMALPLLLGAGVDYSIHMQLALRRHEGSIAVARATVGRALMLCAGTTITGFGSNAWSSNSGLVSLGQVCAAGIACSFFTSVFLLPHWWRAVSKRLLPQNHSPASRSSSPAPSSLYRSEFWRFGLWLARTLSPRQCAWLVRWLADVYWTLARHRREVVIQNLLPALNDDRTAAERTAHALFQQFAVKLTDLWRYESGLPIDDLLGRAAGWEHLENALAQKRGVLLLTPHLGNWEFGAPWLTQRGVTLQVVTLAEPGERFTKLRQASRARWNIETIVIGDDPFAFLEIIRRLEAGATVALLVDRPSPPTAVNVELFGRRFAASIAAAELARASGCVLLPVYLPRECSTYGAHVLPAIPYERATLRDRSARQRLTQQIMRAFEPVIREHLDQWYHFVPVWPVDSTK